MIRVLFAAMMVAALVGCRGESAPAPDETIVPEGPPPISEAEARRGKDACEHYKKRICECAAGSGVGDAGTGDGELARECGRADSRIEGMTLQLRALAAQGDMEPKDRRVVQAAVRKAIKACIEDTAQLDATCPSSR